MTHKTEHINGSTLSVTASYSVDHYDKKRKKGKSVPLQAWGAQRVPGS